MAEVAVAIAYTGRHSTINGHTRGQRRSAGGVSVLTRAQPPAGERRALLLAVSFSADVLQLRECLAAGACAKPFAVPPLLPS